MSGGKRLRQFEQDIELISAQNAHEAGIDVALRFIDDLEILIYQVAQHPAMGSNAYAELGIPQLRSKATSSFPYILLYAEVGDQAIFWRILHGHRDIPATFRAADEPVALDD